MPITQILLTAATVSQPPTPTYTLTPVANNVNEGSELTFTVGGTNIVNGTYYWTIQTNAGDFATTNGTVVVTSNSGTFGVTPTADTTTEGAETFTVALRSVSTSGTILVTSTAVTINDTSQAPPEPTYTITPAANNVNEGSGLEFTVGGTNITNGTYYWTISGVGPFDAENGPFTITDNAGSITVTPQANQTTNNVSRPFTVSIRSYDIFGTVLATSSSVVINDTSQDPTYTLTPDADNVNEGSELTFTVGGTDITNGTYYWTVTNSGDFGTASGSFSITSNSGSFGVTPTADTTTEGSETFTVSIRSGSISGTVLQTSNSITINDTSLAPVPPFSLEFTGESDARRLAVQYFQSDWNLSTTWTIEFWSKTNSAIGGGPSTIMSQAPSSGNIDLHYFSGNLVMSDNITLCAEPPRGSRATTVTGIGGGTGSWEGNQGSNIATTGGTGTGLTVDVVAAGSGYAGAVYIHTAGSGYSDGDVITATNGTYNGGSSVSFTISVSQPVWTHVAISSDAGLVKVYYNGIQQSSAQRNLALTDSTRDLYIGRRGNNNFQYFNGKLALIRISEVARYPTAFNSSISYGVDADTLLFLGTDNPLADLSTYQLNGLTTSASNGGTLYFAKSAYPDLDKQIQAGNTVVNAVTSVSAMVTAAVFTPDGDPNNWAVNVSPAFGGAVNIANFSGIRHTVTNTGVVRTNDVPSAPKLRLAAGTALGFNGTDNRHVIVADNLADWNLGDNWTIEWWQKIPVGIDGFLSVLCQDANVPTYSGIDVFVNNGNIQMFNANLQFSEAAATRGEWNHIAIQKNGTTLAGYINGVSQSLNGSHPGTIAPSSPLNVVIGSRTADGGANFYGQYFNGQLANIRISSVARYTTTFTPPTTVTVDAATRLALSGQVGGSGMLVDAGSNHTITNNGATVDTIA